MLRVNEKDLARSYGPVHEPRKVKHADFDGADVMAMRQITLRAHSCLIEQPVFVEVEA